MIRRILPSLLLATMILSVGCAAQKDLRSFDNKLQKTTVPLMKSPDYTVGAQDVLHVEVRGQADLADTVVVRPDGKITLRLIGDIYVSSMTPEQIKDKLQRSYADYIRSPDVTVAIVSFNSKEITIWGQVDREGTLPYTGEMTIDQAIARSGGMLTRAEPKAVQIARGNKVWKVNMDDIIINGKTDQKIYLQPDDIVFVPMNGYARVGYALDNIFFPIRSLFSFVFLGDSVHDLKVKHRW